MDEKEPNLWMTALTYGGMVATWATGEAGKIFVAGGAGGMFRWLMASRRSLRDGAVAVVAGAIVARYMWPFTLALIEKSFPGIGQSPDAIGMAAFASGLGGMSIAKLVIAVIEVRARKVEGGDPNA